MSVAPDGTTEQTPERPSATGYIQRSLCAGILFLQAVALVPFSAVLLPLTDLSTPAALSLGIGLPVACVVAAGALRTRIGVWLGWAVEAATLLCGVVVPLMIVLGVVFLALYAGAWALGRKIDRERAERTAAWEAEQAAAGADD